MKGAKAGHYLSGAITYIKSNDKKSVVRLPKFTTSMYTYRVSQKKRLPFEVKR